LARRRTVKPKHTVKVGGKWFTLRKQQPFFPEFAQAEMEATDPQVHHLAMGSAVLLVEKLLAGNPRGFPTVIRIGDLPKLPKRYRGTVDRKPFRHRKLNEEYLEWKVHKGYDPRPLIATGFYIRNIEVVSRKRKTARFWKVQVPNIIHEPSGEPLRTLVGWLEYGTASSETHPGIPARPHWRPTALIVRRQWARLPNNIRVEALKKTLRKLQ